MKTGFSGLAEPRSASITGPTRASWALVDARRVKSSVELRMKMILAEGARRLYSRTYLARARGGAFIQNARRTIFEGLSVSSVSPVASGS